MVPGERRFLLSQSLLWNVSAHDVYATWHPDWWMGKVRFSFLFGSAFLFWSSGGRGCVMGICGDLRERGLGGLVGSGK